MSICGGMELQYSIYCTSAEPYANLLVRLIKTLYIAQLPSIHTTHTKPYNVAVWSRHKKKINCM